MLLPLMSILAVLAARSEANVINIDDPSGLLPDGSVGNNFPDETQINQAEHQLNSPAADSELFDTSKCAKCPPDQEFEKGRSGAVISCKCVDSEFFHGDMKLSETTRPIVSALFSGSSVGKGFTGIERLYWPKSANGKVKIPYTIEENFPHGELLQRAFDEYKNKTCIEFVERRKQKNYIDIGNRGGCWAYVGKIGGRQQLSLGPRCGRLGIVEHELMHVLGFFHEQSRPDRHRYVDIKIENVLPGFQNNFDRMINIDSGNSSYDIGSVMHYGEYAFSRNGNKTIVVKFNPDNRQVGQRVGFSQSDLEQINDKYCRGAAVTTTTTTRSTTTKKTTTPAPTTPKPSQKGCRNRYNDANCAQWVKKGYCKHTYVSTMKKYCRKACKFCRPTRPKGLKCGKPKIAFKDDDKVHIVGGQEVIPGSIPWQASLRFAGGAWCGGSWIGGEWILTAAHCVEQSNLQHYTVYLGLHYTKPEDHPDSKHVSYDVEKLVIHKKYNSQTMENDIALLKLTKKVKSTDYIVPVCLVGSSHKTPDGTVVTVSGWGDTEERTEVPTVALMKVNVKVVNREQCKSWIPMPILDGMVCAGLKEGEKDSCQGDSGGPLTRRIRGRRWQVGVVSWGFGCARQQKPGIYTEVSYFRNWIKANSGI